MHRICLPFRTGGTDTNSDLHIELLKSILEQWDSDSGRPLTNFFYNNTQTLVTLLQSTSSKSTKINQNKTCSLIIH